MCFDFFADFGVWLLIFFGFGFWTYLIPLFGEELVYFGWRVRVFLLGFPFHEIGFPFLLSLLFSLFSPFLRGGVSRISNIIHRERPAIDVCIIPCILISRTPYLHVPTRTVAKFTAFL